LCAFFFVASLIWFILLLTSRYGGATWNDIGTPLDENGIKLWEVMIILMLDFILYFVLTLYVDNIRPGQYENIQPWNYFFKVKTCKNENNTDDIFFLAIS